MGIRIDIARALLVLCAVAPSARSQTPVASPPTGSYVVFGTVVDPDGHPLSGADIALVERDSTRRRVRSDSSGQFLFDGLKTAAPSFRLRRLGYEPKTVSVHVSSADRIARVVLTLDVATLDAVLVEETPGKGLNSRLAGFYDRVRTNSFGRYITEAELEKIRPHYASEALQGLAGVTVRSSARATGNTVRFRNCGVQYAGPERTGPLVWVDGVRAKGAELDEVTQGEDIAAIEVYPSLAGVPAQFFDRTAVCGTIVVWTKSK